MASCPTRLHTFLGTGPPPVVLLNGLSSDNLIPIDSPTWAPSSTPKDLSHLCLGFGGVGEGPIGNCEFFVGENMCYVVGKAHGQWCYQNKGPAQGGSTKIW